MNIKQKSKIIYNNCKDLESFHKDDDILIEDEAEAYLIQDEFIRLKEIQGYGDIGGWKVALTNPEMQKLVGVNRPVEGAILKPLIFQNNITLNINDYCHLGAEAEIALKINRNIPIKKEGYTNKEELIPYLKEAMVALEIVDDRNYGANITFKKLVAQNSMNHGCVIGEPLEIDLISLDSLKGSSSTTNDTNPAKASIIVSLNTVPELSSPEP